MYGLILYVTVNCSSFIKKIIHTRRLYTNALYDPFITSVYAPPMSLIITYYYHDRFFLPLIIIMKNLKQLFACYECSKLFLQRPRYGKGKKVKIVCFWDNLAKIYLSSSTSNRKKYWAFSEINGLLGKIKIKHTIKSPEKGWKFGFDTLSSILLMFKTG